MLDMVEVVFVYQGCAAPYSFSVSISKSRWTNCSWYKIPFSNFHIPQNPSRTKSRIPEIPAAQNPVFPKIPYTSKSRRLKIPSRDTFCDFHFIILGIFCPTGFVPAGILSAGILRPPGFCARGFCAHRDFAPGLVLCAGILRPKGFYLPDFVKLDFVRQDFEIEPFFMVGAISRNSQSKTH